MSHLLQARDLSHAQIGSLVSRSLAIAAGAKASATPGRVVGLAFLEASLRTRVGFAVASNRLGWSAVDVWSPRQSPTSNAEPWTETLRVLSGMVDIVVARPGVPLERCSVTRWATSPVVNGGDTGSRAEHPTQALIDIVAIERFLGPVQETAIGIVGDLTTRVARSFLQMLDIVRPRRVVLFAPPRFDESANAVVPANLSAITEYRSLPDVTDLDVVSAIGLPHGAVADAERHSFIIDRPTLDALAPHAIVLSPMPVLDEIDARSLDHPRLRVYQQSDLAVSVRMAILEMLDLELLAFS